MEMDFTKVKLNKEQQNNAFLIGSKAQEAGIDPDLEAQVEFGLFQKLGDPSTKKA